MLHREKVLALGQRRRRKEKKRKEKKKQRMRKLATAWGHLTQTDKRLTKLLRFKRFEQYACLEQWVGLRGADESDWIESKQSSVNQLSLLSIFGGEASLKFGVSPHSWTGGASFAMSWDFLESLGRPTLQRRSLLFLYFIAAAAFK